MLEQNTSFFAKSLLEILELENKITTSLNTTEKFLEDFSPQKTKIFLHTAPILELGNQTSIVEKLERTLQENTSLDLAEHLYLRLL